MPKINKKDTTDYVSISPDGDFRLPANEGDEGAVKRTYKVKNEDGNEVEKHKWEILVNSISGKISDINIVETKFGNLIQVILEGDEESDELAISTSTSNNFGTDLMKKLPNLDLSKNYFFSPYSFTGDKGKEVKGINITEGEEYDKKAPKVKNFFWDAEKEKSANGFPEPDKGIEKLEGKKKSNAWKKYFMDVEEFLIEYTEKNVISKISKDDILDNFDVEEEAEKAMA